MNWDADAIIISDGQLPVLYDFCVGYSMSRQLTVGSMPVKHSVLNVKGLVGAFNQGSLSVIIQLRRLIVYSTNAD